MSYLRSPQLSSVRRVLAVCVPASAAVLSLAVAAPLGAQQAPRASQAAPREGASGGVLTGVVYDSLFAERPLSGAEVWVEGTQLTARTDGAGRFRLTGVPAGRHRVTFYHPTLEAVNVGAPVRQVELPAGGEAELRLVTPAAATVFGAFCTTAAEPRVGVLLGRIRGGVEPVPAANAEVALSWNVWTLERGAMRRSTREAAARTSLDGTFFVCQVPTDVPVQLRVQLADGTVTVDEVSLRDRAAGVTLLDVPTIPATAVTSSAGTSAVVGVLRTAQGKPVPNAQVEVTGGGPTVMTDATGTFVVRDVTPGVRWLEARAIGFRPVRTRVALDPDRTARVSLAVSDAVTVLATNRVTERAVAAALAGFEERRARGNGSFITAEEIDRRRPYSINDLFVGIPGVKVVLPDGSVPGASSQVVFQRGLGQAGVMANTCQPVVFIDGVRFAYDVIGGVDALLRPQEIHGIEVHRNLVSAPPQYQPLDSSCGIILVWTKRGSRTGGR